MAQPKAKPQRRVAGRSKFRLPERQPRAAETNPLRELLQEAKAQEEALASAAAEGKRHTPAKQIAGVSRSPRVVVRHTPAKNVAGVSTKAAPSPAAGAVELAPTSFAEFSKRWSPILRSGQMSVCRVLFELTHAVGEAECFTSMPRLAESAGLKERQCYNVVAQLEQLGFIERPEIFNTPSKKGTVFRLFLSPHDPPAESNRLYHIGEGN